ncbi:MAG: D-alanyl-D-alanine carboxypeptidase/D-alanyl-D-alanine-endopeptidase [Pseudomonadota bacterium]
MNRRRFLTAAMSLTGTGVSAEVLTSPIPKRRPDRIAGVSLARALTERVEEAGLRGRVSYLIADALSGHVLAQRFSSRAMPPASTAKALTAAYALDRLGPAFRFSTELIANGPIRDGQLQGDLCLVGSGDPLLSTDDLAGLAAELRALGVQEVTGGFKIWSGALPHIWEIDPAQPDHLRYSPSVSGLNLNFNRVRLGWAPGANGYKLSLDARTKRHIPPVSVIQARLSDRNLPVFDHVYDDQSQAERWSLARSALNGAGARWLPVRQSGDFAADVFRYFAGQQGIALPRAERLNVRPNGAILASHISQPLSEILRGLLRYSTNISAEAVGLRASLSEADIARVEDLPASGAMMTRWAEQGLGFRDSALRDHSGLSGLNQVTARDMVAALISLAPQGGLYQVLPPIGLVDSSGVAEPFGLKAKTGTLNFVSCLAGYIEPPSGRVLCFAILTDAPDRRANVAPEDREAPSGSAAWTRRSRIMQYDLVRLAAGHASV